LLISKKIVEKTPVVVGMVARAVAMFPQSVGRFARVLVEAVRRRTQKSRTEARTLIQQLQNTSSLF
jgi:hypothetical protein